MTRLRRFISRIVEVMRRSTVERELDEELRLHQQLLIEDYKRRGLSATEARRQAAMTMGGIDQTKERVRDTRGFPSADAFLKDARHALRLLLRSPGFSTVSILTLALGIGVNVAIFSLVDAVVLRPLAYPDADRLISIWEVDASRPAAATRSSVAPGNLADYQKATSFSGIAGLETRSRNLTSGGPPEAMLGEEVTHNYFDVLGIRPAIGRAFTKADMSRQSESVVILSDGLWRRRFGADPALLGRTIVVDGEQHQVVGVMPARFRSLTDYSARDGVHLWFPARYPPELLANRGDHEIRLVARLADGVSLATTRSELTATSESLAHSYPQTNEHVRTAMQPLRDDIVRNVWTSLVVLMLTVALILTIACVNVANLLLARGVGRRGEIAVRFALGATRLRVLTTLVTESLVLAAIAGAAGGVLAAWMTNVLVAAAPTNIPRLEEVALDGRVLAYTVIVAVATGLVFGLIPAWQAGHSRPADALAGAGRVVASRSVMRWRNALMLGQLALSALLLVGAGLMVKSLLHLNNVSLGFETHNVMAMRMVLPEARYRSPESRLRFFQELESRVAAMPGVEAVGFANQMPMRGGWGSGFLIDGVPPSDRGHFGADFQAVSPGYFETLGIRLEQGRLVSEADTHLTQPSAVVSRLFERQFLGGASALGRQFRRGPNMPWIVVVGVVADVRRDGRTSNLNPQVYLPAAQIGIYPVRLADLAVRTAGNPADLVPAIRAAVWSIDPEQPITNVRTLDEILVAASAERRFQALLFSMFAILALVLASIGTYGVVAYVVSQRTPEIGMRLALGASVWQIYRWLLTRTAVIVVAGAALGLVGARWLARYVSRLLFDVAVGDPASYALAAAVLVVVALGACVLAGRRAARINPTMALRYE